MTNLTDAVWRKSTRSQNNGACVEAARLGDLMGIRDSKNPDGPVLRFTRAEFEAFLHGAAQDEFANRPA